MTNKKIATAISLSLLASVALVGCGQQTSTNGAQGTSEQVFNYYLPGEPSTLDPSKVNDGGASDIMGQIYEGLTRIKDGKAVPGIAKSWTVSPDGLTYTFHLRSDAKWSDGTPVTAADFAYSWKRTLNPKTASPYAFMAEWIKGGKEYNAGTASADTVAVKAINDTTLQVTLVHPVPFFINQMAFAVFYPEKQSFVEKTGDKFGSDVQDTLYDGPFVLNSWTHDQSVTVTKNPSYWDQANVKLQKATWQIVSDNNTLENLYQSGQIDGFSPVADQVDRYKGKPEYSISPELQNGYLIFNGKQSVFANTKIRQALAYAVDNTQLVNVVYHNGTQPATGFVPIGTSDGAGGDFRKDNGDLLKSKENAPKAKQLLQEGLKELHLSAFPQVTLLTDDSSTGKKTGEFLQAQWKQNLGIDVNVNSVPRKLDLQQQSQKNYQIALTSWGADYDDPMTFLDMFVSGSSMNDVSYQNPAYDKLINGAEAENNTTARKELMMNAEKTLLNDMAVAPLYFSAKPLVMQTYVKGWSTYPSFPEYSLKYVSIEGK